MARQPKKRAQQHYRHRFPTQHNKVLGPHHHEASEFMTQNPLNVIRLFNLDGESEGIDGGLNQDLFILVAGNDNGLENDFLGRSLLHK